MANQSKGPLILATLDLAALNDRLRQIRDELDTLTGLRGPVTLYDTLTAQTVLYVDSNSQLLHGWGSCL